MTHPLEVDTDSRTPLMSSAFRSLLMAEFGAMVAFYLLSSAVPMYAATLGASDAGAGFTTGILMLATVLTDLGLPRLIARWGHRTLFGAGLVLLGAPAFALSGASSLTAILAISAIRGVGFAFIAVIGAALTASLAPKERRGEALGLYGAVGSLPAIVALPLGVWLVQRVGYAPVFIASAVCAIAGLPLLSKLPKRLDTADAPLGLARVMRRASIMRPAVVFMCAAMASGAIITFLPFMVSRDAGSRYADSRNAALLAAVALLVQAVVSTITRWWSGRRADGRGTPAPLWPGVVIASAGLSILALSTNAVSLIGAMTLFGAGFGMALDASLNAMLNRVSSADYDSVSTVWNMAYDLGWGLGAAVLGLVAAGVGYHAAFLLLGLACLAVGHLLLRTTHSKFVPSLTTRQG